MHCSRKFLIRTRIFIAILLLGSHSNLLADLFDHMKKPEGKSSIHTMRNIDFIYMINLDERPEKFEQANSELNRYEIYPYRFSAVNGWKLSLETINDVGLKYRPGMTSLFATSFPLEAGGQASHGFMKEEGRAYFGHCLVPGTIGIVLSHLSILQDAFNSGYETIWVLEDDVIALKDPRVLSDLIEKLDATIGKDNWDVLFTDQNSRSPNGESIPAMGAAKRPDMDCSLEERYSEKYTINKEVSEDFREISARFGAYSMIIRRSGIEKLLRFFAEHKIYLPYDLDYYLPEGMYKYALRYDVVTNLLEALSDNGSPGYQKKSLQ
ncbi:MAG: glycosyltransferase family 25 protein [Chlamydiota bacterium]